ncbi:MAG: pyridoxamine 5'-phosphate oxidase family protein [Pseudomonadota bacterium]
MKKKLDVLRPVDDEARRIAKTLVRTARFGALATLEPETGVPLASRVAVAPDGVGTPVILMSSLSAHATALQANPVCSLLVGEPGRGDPLAHPRITVIGRAAHVDGGTRDPLLRHRFLARHPKAALYIDFGDFAFWRLEVERASLNAGFGKAYALQATDVLSDGWIDTKTLASPAIIDWLNSNHAQAFETIATTHAKRPSGAWQLANVDPEGMDLVLGDAIARCWFDRPVASEDQLRMAILAMASAAD